MKRCIIIFFLLIVFSSFASQKSAQQLQQLLQRFHSLSANFSQQIVGVDQQQVKTIGMLKIRRPGEFFWQVSSPNKQILNMRHGVLSIYDPLLEQVMVRKITTAHLSPFLLLSMSSTTLLNHFVIQGGCDQDNLQNICRFVVKPKVGEKNNAAFQQTTLWFNHAVLQKVTLLNSLSQQIQIDLSKIKMNPEFAESEFILHLPKDVDVIHG